jgi:hypothetical protein
MTDVFQGKVLSVEAQPTGDRLSAPIVAGATVLPLGNVVDFPVGYGSLYIDGVVYSYNNVDQINNTITLTSGVGTDLDEGTPVMVYPFAEEKYALVSVGDFTDGVRATVPHYLSDKLDVGIRGPVDDQESVTLVVERSEWSLRDIIALPPTINGAYLTPGSITPESLSDGVPPAVSPTPNAVAGIGSVFLNWAAVDNHDTVTYKVYGGTSAGINAATGTLIAETGSTSLTTRSLGSTALAYNTDYWFFVVATDVDGAAPPGGVVGPVQTKQVTTPDVSSAYVYAGEVYAEQLRSGNVAADFIISGSFKTANAGQRVEIGSFGIKQYGPDGTSVAIDLPTDPDVIAKFSGVLNAFGAIINDGLELRGQKNKFATSSIVTLAAAIGGSNTPPNLSVGFASYTDTSGLSTYLFNIRGYHRSTMGGPIRAGYNFLGETLVVAPNGRYQWPKVTAANGDTRSSFDTDSHTWISIGGNTRLVSTGLVWENGWAAGTPKMLVMDDSTMNTNGTVAPTVLQQTGNPGWGLGIQNRLGRCFSASGNARASWFVHARTNRSVTPHKIIFQVWEATSDTTSTQRASLTVDIPFPTEQFMGGVAFGNMARMGFYQTTTNDVFCVSSGTHMYVFNATTGARILNAEFDLAGNADNVTALGSLASNDFERFESAPNYSWPDMTVTPYTNVDWNGVDGDTWWAAYTWADTDAGGSGTHETNMSSLSSVTMKKRAQMTVTAPPLPDPVAGVGNPRGVDDVNAFRIYMQHGVVAPSRVNLWKQPVQPVNLATSVVLSTLPVWSGTTNPPISSTFPSQAPAVIRSDAVGTDGDPKVLLNGEGVALFETIKVAGEGALSLQGRAFEQLLYGIRTQSILSGGGKVSVSTAYEVKWSYRFRTMAGRGPRTATAGYFDVVVPATGFVVPGVGGATAKTVTAGGIPLNAGDALYYALPYSGSSASVSGNFRVAGYTSDFTIPNDWILLSAVPEAKYVLVLSERDGGIVRGSLRSLEHHAIDVSAIAKTLGGGGHKLASGFEVPGKIIETTSGWQVIPT